MPRKPRIDLEGLLYHVVQRGNNRTEIFRDSIDYAGFLKRLDDLFRPPAAQVYAWALMPNHVHLVVRRGVVPLARLMHRLWTGHSLTFNRRHGRSGHLREHCYDAFLCEDENYLLELLRYVHLNPLKAGLVCNLEALEQFPWTGHGPLIRGTLPAFQEEKEVLGLFHQDPANARHFYRIFVEDGWNRILRKRGATPQEETDWSPLAFLETSLAFRAGEESTKPISIPSLGLNDERSKRSLGQIFFEVEAKYGIGRSAILSSRRDRKACKARAMFCHLAQSQAAISGRDLACLLGVSKAAVTKMLVRGKRFAGGNGEEKTDAGGTIERLH